MLRILLILLVLLSSYAFADDIQALNVFNSPQFEVLSGNERFKQRGPHRDELGEVLRTYNLRYANNAGLAWDGELIWGTTRANNRRLYAINPENGEVVHDYPLNQGDAIGLLYDPVDNVFWVNFYTEPNNPSIAYVYNSEGENLRQIRLPRGGHWDFCSDGENIYGYSENVWNNNFQDDRLYKISRDGEVLQEGPNLTTLVNHGRAVSVTFAPAHHEGHFWLMSVGFISQIAIDWEENTAEVIQEFQSQNSDYPHQGLTYDGFNLIAGGRWDRQELFIYDDGIEESYGVIKVAIEELDFGPIPIGDSVVRSIGIRNAAEEDNEISILYLTAEIIGENTEWLTLNPPEAEVEARAEMEIDLTAETEGLDFGRHQATLRINANDPKQPTTEIPVEIFVVEGFGRVFGSVVDFDNNNVPIVGATITIGGFGLEAQTDNGGQFVFERVPAWEYEIIITADDFLPIHHELNVGRDDNIELFFELKHSRAVLTPNQVSGVVGPGEDYAQNVRLSNIGNGPLTWSSTLSFPEGTIHPTMSLVRQWEVGNILEDPNIRGAIFVDGKFYIAGRANNQKLISVLDQDGNFERSFALNSDGLNGFQDLAWDGEWLWGTASRGIIAFNLEGEEVARFEGPYANNSVITWDSENEVLWIGATTSNMVAYTREGEQRGSLNRKGLRIYGLSYYPDDPDGYNLYILSHTADAQMQLLHKMNTANEDTMFVGQLDTPPDASPFGLHIAHDYDPNNWIAFQISNEGANDKLNAWQLRFKDWLSTSPTEGVVEANNSTDIEIEIDGRWLIPFDYSADVLISHDGVDGNAVLPINISVSLGRVNTMRRINLENGWNMISVNVDPEESDIPSIFAPLVDEGVLELVKSGFGNFYNVEFGFNNIPFWDVKQGYLVKMTSASTLEISGESVLPNDPIQLERGWQIISYFPRAQVDASVAFGGIVDILEIAKDGFGRFYLPAFDFSNMGNLRETMGYQVKLTEDVEFVYNSGQNLAGLTSHFDRNPFVPEDADGNMSLLLLGKDIEDAQVAVYAGDVLVGKGNIKNGVGGIAVWGGEGLASEKQALRVEIRDNKEIIQYELENISGDGTYTKDGLWVVEVNSSEIITNFELSNVYPNPFNNSTRIQFGLPEASYVTLDVYDVTGRKVSSILSGRYEAGVHNFTWNASELSNGIYFLRLSSGSQHAIQKVLLTK